MTRFILAELWRRRSRSVGLGVGILVAAVSFTLLTAAVNAGELRIRGTVERNFGHVYDLLVRSRDSFTPIERSEGLVAPNFASGIFGGISIAQWHEVLDVPGVEVAAPIANLGYIAPFARVKFRLDRFLTEDPVQLYRLHLTWSADRGLSRYPGADSFVYYTRRNPIVELGNEQLERLRDGRLLEVCYGFNRSNPPVPNSPFVYSTRAGWGFQCFSERSPEAARLNVVPFPSGSVGAGTDVIYPILIAGIDPIQEDRLLGLDDSVVSGRSLLPSDQVYDPDGRPVIPVLASSGAYVDQSLDVRIERLKIPAGVKLPRILASLRAFRFVTNLERTVVGRRHVSSEAFYRRELRNLERDAGGLQNHWEVSPVRYRSASTGRLAPSAVSNPPSVYSLPCCGPSAGPGNQDVQFRTLENHKIRPYRTARRVDIVGRYDPELLAGFGGISQVPLGAYAPPALRPADRRSRDTLQDQPLFPSMNLGGYIQQPPLMLTTLKGLRFFTDPSNFEGVDPKAPISVIRVRVMGVTGPDELSLARLRSVAQLIRERTRLAVDIVAGSSPSPVLIELPAGNHGRPELLLREEWLRKGVAVNIIRALDRKSLLLFLLVLLVTGLFLANGTLAAVRSRRTEIGTLACLGWSRGRIFKAILLELVVIGSVAGLIGAALALALIPVLSLEMPLWRAALVVPIAVGLACLAGIVPAMRAASMAPLDAILAPVSNRSSSASIRGLVGMAWVNLRRIPARTLVGASGLFIGVAALTVLLAINLVFRGAVVGSLLGNVVSVQVRGVDLLSVVLALLLSGLSIADVLVMNVRDRAAEFVTLGATGWDDRRLGLLVAVEGVTMGFVGGGLGAVLGFTLAAVVGGATGSVLIAAGLAVLVATLISLVASIVPAKLVSRMSAPRVLAEE